MSNKSQSDASAIVARAEDVNALSAPESNTSVIPARISQTELMFNDRYYNKLEHFAERMASGKMAIPEYLRNNPGDCMAIAMQAMLWGMLPHPVAQKTHIVNGTLGYEAQLVNAVIITSGVIDGRPRYEPVGNWEKILGKHQWNPADEEGLGIRVIATLKENGEDRDHTCYMAGCKVRNSPLWKSKPQIQNQYQALKEWSRLHTPDVILGVYTVDELDPQPNRVEIREIPNDHGSSTSNLAAKLEAADGTPIDTKPEPEVKPEEEAKPPATKKVSKTAMMKAVARLGVPDHLVNSYLVSQAKIQEGEDYLSLPEEWKTRIVENPDGFKAKIQEFVNESA